MKDLKEEIELSPFKYLFERTIELEKYIFNQNFRFFQSFRADFSWVWGLSEVEIKDYSSVCNSTRSEIKNRIKLIDNQKLKDKLNEEFALIPIFSVDEFIVNSTSYFFVIKLFMPIKNIRKTAKFKGVLEGIRISSERMINLIENKEWLEF